MDDINHIASLDSSAYALRPARILGDELRNYTATTFPDNPFDGCALTIRRLEIVKGMTDQETNQWIDVLSEEGDILQEIQLTKKGFEYLRQKLKFTVDNE